MLTCSVDSLAVEAITSLFLRREMFVMGGYPPVAEQTSIAISFEPFNGETSGCPFQHPGHSIDDLSIMVIERMKNEDPDLRKKRESYWIHPLQSLSPTGMNLDP